MDHVLYINLNHRKDRKEHVERQLSLLGITGTRMPAILPKNGALGCIMEDDIMFTNIDVFKTSLSHVLPTKWDVLLLGTNMAPPFEQIDEHHARVFNAQTTTGYIVKQHYYETLLNNFKESLERFSKFPIKSLYAIDIYWKQLQKRDQWYVLTPLTIIQIPGYSDIEHAYLDYSRAMLAKKDIV